MKNIIINVLVFFSLTLNAYAIETHNKTIEVYKNPYCGCCSAWISHMEDNGFDAMVKNRDSLVDVKKQYKVPARLQACHTAISDNGFFFEGHVLEKYVTQLLDNPPLDAIGLAVPAMPMGSPGMEVGQFMPYEVLLIKADGSSEVFAKVDRPNT